MSTALRQRRRTPGRCQPVEIGAGQRERQEGRAQRRSGKAAAPASKADRCSRASAHHRRRRRACRRPPLAGDETPRATSRPRKNVARHVALAARRDAAAAARSRPAIACAQPAVARQLGVARRRAGSRPAPQAGSAPRRSRRNSLRGRCATASGRRRDRRCAPRDSCRRPDAAGRDRGWRQAAPRRRDGRPPPRRLGSDQVAPPLQPDLAGQRLADPVADAGDLGVEG